MTQKLPWAHLPTLKIRMIKSDVWEFGPTILEAGKTYMLPEATARYFIGQGTAILVRDSNESAN